MTAILDQPASVGVIPSHRASLLSLARFEGRRMISHRLNWLGALLAVGLAVNELREQSPVLNRVSVTLAWTMLPLAMTVALVAGWSVLRARASSDVDPPAVVPLPMGQRVAGIVIGLFWPAFLTLVVQGLVLVWILFRDPVTSLVWAELLVGPIYVIFAGALAAAMSRWIPHSATPLFTVLLLGAMMIALPYNQATWGRVIDSEWLKPMVWPQNIIPYEVSFRPAGLHLLYLVGLVIVVAGVAIVGREWLGWAVLASGMAVAFVVGPMQLGIVTDVERAEAISQMVGDSPDLICEAHSGVEYCAMPGYGGWIDDWATTAKPVIEASSAFALEGIEVRQYPVHNSFLLDGDQATYDDWWWIGSAYDDYAKRDAVAVGSVLAEWEGLNWLAGLAPRIVGCAPWTECPGEAQRVLVFWLNTQYPAIQTNTINDPSWGEEYANVTDCIVKELWANPNAKQLVLDNWGVLTTPETSYEEAGAILNVSVPTGYDTNGSLPSGCP